MDYGIPTPAERKVAESVLFPRGWTIKEVADAMRCSTAVIITDCRSAKITTHFPDRLTNRRDRFVANWRTMADHEAPAVVHEWLRRVLNYEEAKVALAAAIEVCRMMQEPDLSELPEWQQLLVKEVFGERPGDQPKDEGGYYWGDLMSAVRREEVTLTESARDNASVIARWVEKRMHVRAFVRPRIGAEWAERIEEAIAQLGKRRAFVIRQRFMGPKTFREIGCALGLSSERARGVQTEAFRMLRGSLRGLGVALNPYAQAAGERERIAALEREVLLLKTRCEASASTAPRAKLVGELPTPLLSRVAELELTVRTMLVLERAEVEFVWQLVEKTPDDLLRYKYFGPKSLYEINDVLARLDLSLGTHFAPAVRARLEVLTTGTRTP